jgi:hypothetical protein
LCGINTLKAEERCNDDYDDNDTDIPNEAIEATNDIDYELQPQNPNLAISHPLRS